MGYDKPTDVRPATNLNPYAGMGMSSGLSYSEKFAINAENAVTTDAITGGQSVDEMQLSYIKGTPMLTRIVQLNDDSPTLQISGLDSDEKCYADLLTRFFKFHSGSYKFKIYINASKYQTIRLVFFISASSNTTDWQNCIHQVVDVKGDTTISFTTPYMENAVAKQNVSGAFESLLVKVLTWNQPNPAANTPIYLNVYKACAEDFQFGMQRDMYYEDVVLPPGFAALEAPGFEVVELESNPREDFGEAFEPIHPDVSSYSHQNVVFGENVTHLCDMIHRTFPYFQQTTTSSDHAVYSYVPIATIGSGRLRFGIEMFGQLFLMWRGSIRIKIIPRNQSLTRMMYVKKAYTGIPINYSIAYPNNPMMQAEVPFYTDRLFHPTRGWSTDPMYYYWSDPASTSNVNHMLLKEAGDDFSFQFLCYPESNNFLPTDLYLDDSIGVPGLARFFRTGF
jgi:hypothetical protein